MGKSLVGNVIYFWIFVIGGLFIGRFFGITETKATIFLLIVLGVFYWLVALMRFLLKKRRERKKEEGR